MFGGKFQNVWREAKKWQRRVASFFVDRIPYGKLAKFSETYIRMQVLCIRCQTDWCRSRLISMQMTRPFFAQQITCV